MNDRTDRQDSLRAVGTSFRPDIEGLRAIAVVLVLLEHAGVHLVSGGYIGVDVFFVLSGFLITGLLLKEIERNGRVSLVAFYARRARRLLPASTLVLVATVIASFVWIRGERADRIADDAIWSSLFAANIRFIVEGTDYMNAELPASPLQHFWSLAVEEQFYAAWPLLMMLVAWSFRRVSLRLRLSVALVAIIGASLAWSVYETGANGTAAYFSPFTRAHELAIGALLAVASPWLARVPGRIGAGLAWAGLILVLVPAVVFGSTTSFPGALAMIPVLGSALVVGGGVHGDPNGPISVLRLAPFQTVGRLSYSLYLWHWPILVIAAAWAGSDLALPANLVLCLLALGLAQITYVLVENPVRNAAVLKRAAPITSLSVGVVLIVFSLGISNLALALQATQGERVSEDATLQQLPLEHEVLAAVAAGVDVTDWPVQPPRISNIAYSKACNVSRSDTSGPACVFGDPEGKTTAVIYGDSQAAMWVPALDLIGKQEGIRFHAVTKPGCAPVGLRTYSYILKREYTECNEYRTWAMDKIEEIQPDVVLMTGAFRGLPLAVNGEPVTDGVSEAWMDGLSSTVDQLELVSGRVVVIGEMPYPNDPGIDCLSAHPGDVGACDTPIEDAVDAEHNRMQRQTAEAAGATYIDVTPWYCTDAVCPAVIGGLTVHRDRNHTGENYVVYLAQVLGEATGLVPEGDRLTPPAAESAGGGTAVAWRPRDGKSG
ncbi:MAG: acyltransferase family protein [Thermomicrobiales bacterium]